MMLSSENPVVAAEIRGSARRRELVVFVLSSDERQVHVFSPFDYDVSVDVEDVSSLDATLASFEDPRFPNYPMIVGRDITHVRQFLRATGLASDDDDAFRSFNWTWLESCDEYTLKRQSCKDSGGRLMHDGSLTWWSEDDGWFNFVAGGVRGDVHKSQTVMWDERNKTTRRDRQGRAAVFCDPSPGSRSSRQDWSKKWPRVICIESFTDQRTRALEKHHVRMMSFVRHRCDVLSKWLDADCDFDRSEAAVEERNAVQVIVDAEASLPRILSTNDESGWLAHHARLLADFQRDSKPIQRLDLDHKDALTKAEMSMSFKDDLGMWHTKPGKAALNTRRRALIRLYRREARKRWPWRKYLGG